MLVFSTERKSRYIIHSIIHLKKKNTKITVTLKIHLIHLTSNKSTSPVPNESRKSGCTWNRTRKNKKYTAKKILSLSCIEVGNKQHHQGYYVRQVKMTLVLQGRWANYLRPSGGEASARLAHGSSINAAEI